MDQNFSLIYRVIRRIRKEYVVGAAPPVFPLKEDGCLSHMNLGSVEELAGLKIPL
jgi:hypothetical protein